MPQMNQSSPKISVLFLTINSMSPPHPRISTETSIINRYGHKAETYSLCHVVNKTRLSNRIFRALFFNPVFIVKSLCQIRKVPAYSHYVFYDLHLLPVAIFWKLTHPQKHVYYETIDFNFSLFLYYNFRWLGRYFKILERKMLSIAKPAENKISSLLDGVIVNSDALFEWFNGKCCLQYYTSPFRAPLPQKPSSRAALLFIGAFMKEKGALIALDIAQKLQIEIFIYGPISPDVRKLVDNSPQARYFGNLPVSEVDKSLRIESENVFFFGLSLIDSMHFSYSNQPANKDIDYLALGIPIAGNRREPTYQLISQGAGVLIDDLKMVMNDEPRKAGLSEKCRYLSQSKFSINTLERKIAAFFNLV